ncbi:MAG: restriction endonuclease subunit S [Panacagrimonas sp.]
MNQLRASAPLGTLFKTSSGGTPLKSRKEFYEGGDVPWLLSGEVAQGEVWAASNFITQTGLRNSSAKVFPTDTVLVAMYGATAGQVGILKIHAATNQAVCGILPNDQFVPEYMYYFLLSKKDEFVGKAVGNAQPNISQAKIRETMVPIVGKDVQRRIVTILDGVFDGIATAKANAEKNLRNARDLLDSFVSEQFTNLAISHGTRRLADAVDRLTNGYVGPIKSVYIESGIPYLLARHVRDNHLNFDGQTFVSPQFNEKHKKSKLKTGDVLLVQSGHIGHAAVVGPEHDGHNCHAMIVLTPKRGLLLGQFLSYFFFSPQMRRLCDEIRSGSTVPHLTCGVVREIAVPIPAFAEQHRIVSLIDSVRAEAERLESLYARKVAALDELKKSVLHQVFTGQL